MKNQRDGSKVLREPFILAHPIFIQHRYKPEIMSVTGLPIETPFDHSAHY